jgi:hypothetical protein
MMDEVIRLETPLSNTFSQHIESAIRTSRSIQEFRLDFLFEEEFSCDLNFARTFLSECAPEFYLQEVLKVQNEVNLGHAVVDLLVIFKTSNAQGEQDRLALLIEDKITAGPAERQGERYRHDGEAHRGRLWDKFKTVLVAPESYVGEKDRFDAFISLERVKEWICFGDPARAHFRRGKIEAAIAKKAATGVQIPDPGMREFRYGYYRLIEELNRLWGTDLYMDPPKSAHSAGDTWFIVRSHSLPDWCRLRHKIRTDLKARMGKVELAFPNTDFSRVGALEDLLPAGMRLISNGTHHQHVAIEIDVPEITDVGDFDCERNKVEQALLAVRRLIQLFHEHRSRVEEIVLPARQPA